MADQLLGFIYILFLSSRNRIFSENINTHYDTHLGSAEVPNTRGNLVGVGGWLSESRDVDKGRREVGFLSQSRTGVTPAQLPT